MSPPPLLLSMGEPAGVCGEITLAAWRVRSLENLPTFAVVGDPGFLRAISDVPIVEIGSPAEAAGVFDTALPVLPVSGTVNASPGNPDRRDAPLVVESIERAVAACMSGDASGIVTNPINKALLYEAGFRHPGHTEFIAELSGADLPVMMIAGPSLRVVPATIHLPLSAVPTALSTDGLVAVGRIVLNALEHDFGCQPPRVAFAGLNPHAGEGGALGLEDGAVIRPAVDQLRREGHDVVGPLPADTMFHASARARYDAAICMYHDQALVPVKTLDFDLGVNVTLGLPIVRTSPDHGTAFDIAGKGIARADSLVQAIRLAGEIADRRAAP
ncbi:MAG: 4-hydroxythreonine-4-phosphate dehydrogenase PdxA [Minwuia sp.]|nr:4-hydroxythreonine-4-phosphate dehydrogenase PdxA [Minwuia sp.]